MGRYAFVIGCLFRAAVTPRVRLPRDHEHLAHADALDRRRIRVQRRSHLNVVPPPKHRQPTIKRAVRRRRDRLPLRRDP
ncbi:MAG: hypothetical protein CMJ49_11830 [Planctomycetaceae bacterium]|nr:hypothetical protein [Planctomycetaceae bacterium]